MSSADDSTLQKQSRLIALVLALVTILIYLPACFNGFIFFDDPSYVTDNSMVQAGLTWAGWKWAFAGWHASNWHPLTWLSHMLDCELFGLNPAAHHFVNVLFHALNAVLVFSLWRRLTAVVWPSAIIAALFAWHPLHVESVAWVSERKDVLSMTFGLLALRSYANYARNNLKNSTGRRRDYFLTLIFLALALMAKPMMVTLPFVFLLLDYWPLQRIGGNQARAKKRGPLLAEKLPFFLLAAVSCLLTFLAQRGHAVMSLQRFPLTARLENAAIAYVDYIFKIIWPVNLGILYPLSGHAHAGEAALALVFLSVISFFTWQLRQRSPSLLTGWLWFLGTLVPVIGLVQVGNQSLADRYTYLPSIGFFAACIFGFMDWAPRFKNGLAPARILAGLILAGLILAGLILAGCIAATEHQLAFWKDTKTLFLHALAITPNNAPAKMMLGVSFEHEGNSDEALRQYREALTLDGTLLVQMPGGTQRPLAAQVALLQAQAAEQQGDVTNAIALYREALRVDSKLVEAHNNLANLLDESGRIPEAIEHYQTAIQLAPSAALAHENLGTLLLKISRFDEAMRQYQEASRLQPDDARPYYLSGKAWLRRGQSTEAIAQFRHALEVDAGDPQSLTFLARLLASDENQKNRNGPEAVAFAEKANALADGKQPFILDTLAMTYAECGRFHEAQQTAGKAIELATLARLPELAAAMQERLRLYQAGQPYREAFTNTLVEPSSSRLN